MNPDRQKRLKELFQSFLEIAPDKRAAFLDESCGDDSALRSELESLIAESVPDVAALKPGIQSTFPTGLDDFIGRKIGRYIINEAIGSGGMGMIYKAEDTRLGRPVAMKFLAPFLLGDEQGKVRFFQEARAAAVLDHQNICTVYEIDEIGGQAFIAMAYIEGQSLKERLVSSPLNLDESLDLTIQTAQGLQVAHEKGIIHRDIKPGNIMVSSQGQPKIVDFGLAKLSGQTGVTRTGVALGTVAYMSPEQARGEVVDHRTDIWSLGVVLFEMLTGHQPFKGEDIQSVISAILHEDLPSLTEYLPGMPRGLEETVKRTLAKNPEERYPHLKDMLVDLRLLKTDPEARVTIKCASVPTSYPSIAVLPFKNLSADPEQEYFCEGMAEEILNALSKLGRLRVAARTSTFAMKGRDLDVQEIGDKLNVETVLEGSVKKANSRVRITAQLINVADGFQLWSERFDREMEDIFAIHDEITLAIVGELKVKLLAGEKSKVIKARRADPEAYQLYLKGRYFWNKENNEALQKSMEFYHRAIEKDPDFALGYSGIADCYFLLSIWKVMDHHEGFRKCREFSQRALELDENLAEAHTSLAMVNHMYYWEFEEAEKRFKRAFELNPYYAVAHQWYAIHLFMKGKHGEGISEAIRAQELEPLSPIITVTVGMAFFYASQFDRALEELQKALELDSDFFPAYVWLIHTNVAIGNFDEALKAGRKLSSLVPEFAPEPEYASWMGPIYAKMGKTNETNIILERLITAADQGYSMFAEIAHIYLNLGQPDKVIEWYERAYEERDHYFIYHQASPDLDWVRSHPKFEALMKKFGLKRS